MKRHVAAVLILLMGACAVSLAKEKTREELLARAEAAPLQKQADLFLEVAERELKTSLAAFGADKNDEGRAMLQELVKHCDRAQAASIQTNKRQKHTEIKLRKISARLRDAKLNVDVNSQAQVQAAIDQIEEFRTELLKSMFGQKKHD